jgi:Rha family phage regulatory protein
MIYYFHRVKSQRGEMMMKLLLNPEYSLYEKDGKAFCDSLQVAETFEKRHDHVLRDIRNVIADIEEDFSLPNFGESNYKERGKKYPKYLLTKDGFTLLTMGYTGKKAMQFKIAYINRFNQVEAFVTCRLTWKKPLTRGSRDMGV